ncbi:hypothetical protein H8E77_36145 [bacterium]|nr:hypothetical protein [bacterium]
MRCFISHRQFDELTCLELTGLTTVHVSIFHITVVRRTNLVCPSHSQVCSLRSVVFFVNHRPFPSASHPTLSSNAVEVKLMTIDYRSGNLTHIALQLARAHHFSFPLSLSLSGVKKAGKTSPMWSAEVFASAQASAETDALQSNS